MTRELSAAGVALLDSSESCRLYTYDDRSGKRIAAGQKPAGKLTAGWGHTGADVKPGMIVTQTQADAWRSADRNRAAACVEQAVTVPLSDNQFAALVDFTFNAGSGAFAHHLLPLVNAGNWPGAIAELRLWVKSGGLVLPGLQTRRAREIALLQTPDELSAPTVMPMPVPSLTPDQPTIWERLVAWLGASS